MKTMAEVLQAHWSASTHPGTPLVDKCDGCGAVLRKWGDDNDMPGQLATHQAAALAAAGYGPVKEAWAQAWDAAVNEADRQWQIGHASAAILKADNPYRAAAIEAER